MALYNEEGRWDSARGVDRSRALGRVCWRCCRATEYSLRHRRNLCPLDTDLPW